MEWAHYTPRRQRLPDTTTLQLGAAQRTQSTLFMHTLAACKQHLARPALIAHVYTPSHWAIVRCICVSQRACQRRRLPLSQQCLRSSPRQFQLPKYKQRAYLPKGSGTTDQIASTSARASPAVCLSPPSSTCTAALHRTQQRRQKMRLVEI